MRIDNHNFVYTQDAYAYLYEKKKVKKVKPRKNATKRIRLPKAIRLQVIQRSKGLCERCGSLAVCIHHVLAVSKYPEIQHEIGNLIHLCLQCHRKRHTELPDILFRVYD